MAIALIANTAAQSTDTNSVTTGSIDTTGATFLIVAITRLTSSAASPSDNKTNTWVLIRTETHSSGSAVDLYYVKNPSSVGAGHTFTTGGAALYPSIFVAAFSGTDTSQNVDQQNGNSASGSGVITIQAGSVTPSVDNELLIAALLFSTVANTTTINEGFTITNQFPVASGLAFGGALAYLPQGAAAAQNPTWSFNADNPAASIATFRPSIAGTGTISFLLTGIGR